MIVRENSEGEYAGVGGRVHRGLPEEVATEVSMFTRAGVARIMRFAFALARSRPRKLLTVVTKSNAQRHGMVMWDEIAAEVAGEFPDVTWDKMLVDAMTMRMTLKPQTLDTIVATNLHADILSDLAAALAGSLGIAPTANLNPERKFPSMFEPIHGSAFDITGKGIANPIGTFWSGVMMLEHLGEAAAAGAPDARDRARHGRQVAAHARPRRQGHDRAGDAGRVRGARRCDTKSCVTKGVCPMTSAYVGRPLPVRSARPALPDACPGLFSRRRVGQCSQEERPVRCGGRTTSWCRPRCGRLTRSPLRLTPIMMSAPKARQSDTGIGLTNEPSTSHRSLMRKGVKRPGNAIEARTASMIEPRVNQVSRPE